MSDQPASQPRPSGDAGVASESGPPRYASFSDYVRVVRRRRILVVLITVLFVGVALAVSLSKTETFRAQAQISFRDVLADLNLLGVGDTVPELAPSQLAQINAELITRPEVTQRVSKRINEDISPGAFASMVSASVGVQTNLVIVTAEAGDAQLAAELANEYARAAKEVGTADQLKRLRLAQKAILEEIKKARQDQNVGVSTIRLSVLEQTLSRVQTLVQISEPVRIVSPAAVPGAPVSPTPARDATLAGLVGLVFGILAAFGRDSLDRRLHTAKEVHDELGVPVLARVPKSALGSAGLAAGAERKLAEADFEAFRVLRMNLAALRTEPPVSVLVTSALPEEGKSTVSMGLASAATVAGQRTLLVECDLRRPSFSGRLGVPREPGLTDYLNGRVEPQTVLRTVDLAMPTAAQGAVEGGGPAGTLVCISAGSPVANPAELLISARFKDFLAKVSQTYDLVVLDGGPMLSIVDPLELVPQVDAVVVCVRAEKTTRDQVRAARAALANLPERPIGAVLTGLKRRGPDSYDYYYGY
jgi:capsular exopolysaccharide synthesis family protein